jgi:hypothetical protein
MNDLRERSNVKIHNENNNSEKIFLQNYLAVLFLALSAPNDVYSRNVTCALPLIFTFLKNRTASTTVGLVLGINDQYCINTIKILHIDIIQRYIKKKKVSTLILFKMLVYLLHHRAIFQ